MKFIVRVKSHLDEPEQYEAFDTYELIDQLLGQWLDGDADMPGVFAFLADHGHEFGITDEEVDESTDDELLRPAADAIREILGIGHDRVSNVDELALFLLAISSEYQISTAADEKGDEDEDEDEEDENENEDEDYDY